MGKSPEYMVPLNSLKAGSISSRPVTRKSDASKQLASRMQNAAIVKTKRNEQFLFILLLLLRLRLLNEFFLLVDCQLWNYDTLQAPKLTTIASYDDDRWIK